MSREVSNPVRLASLMAGGLLALNFFSPAFVDQLKRGRKTATIRLGDKSRKYERGQVVWITIGYQHSPREKIFAAVIDDVEVKRVRELSPARHRARQPGVSPARRDARLPAPDLRPRDRPRGHGDGHPLLPGGRVGGPAVRQRRDALAELATVAAMPDYEFLTTWCLEAPREPSGTRSGTRSAGQSGGAGWLARGLCRGRRGRASARSRRYTWRSRLPYDLEFEMATTKVDKPHLLEGRAMGELAGIGRWRLFEQDGEVPVTAVVYEWNVSTTKPWMNLLAPIARPLFEWNHDWVMRNGGTGLAKLLGCRLLAID